MKTIKFWTLLSCFLLLFGCGTSNENSGNNGTGSDQIHPTEPDEEEAVEDLTGYIISINEGDNLQILVTGHHASYDGISATSYTLEDSTQIEDPDGEPLAATDLKVGLKVTVWNSGIVLDSFPAQSGAVKVVVDTTQEEHEQEAVQKALAEVEAGYPWHVEKVEETGEHQYKVTLKNLLEDSESVDVEVEL
ncbi:DUF3221 domain-containing protein [Sutcliffiella halmapala]|uniref:DUF3221 domain-containing protein n=1 Tax=Sutcliffiella halmapala TaxID=79882 RepID=UPI000995705E|nr:DUF3221 domain-containing protein [Sutcliffiella halmapala]